VLIQGKTMKTLKKVAICIAILLLMLLIIGLLLPSKYEISRSRDIAAPAEKIFPLIVTPKQWTTWSTWQQRDPKMVIAYKGAESGKGAAWSWISKQEGSGGMTFFTAEPNKLAEYEMQFQGWSSKALGRFTLEPATDGKAVKVTWSMSGDLGANPISRYFGLLMDKFVGPEFEQGLVNLEKQAQK
jgi:uncharacterized protein YndB with AHSA1/START domain